MVINSKSASTTNPRRVLGYAENWYQPHPTAFFSQDCAANRMGISRPTSCLHALIDLENLKLRSFSESMRRRRGVPTDDHLPAPRKERIHSRSAFNRFGIDGRLLIGLVDDPFGKLQSKFAGVMGITNTVNGLRNVNLTVLRRQMA